MRLICSAEQAQIESDEGLMLAVFAKFSRSEIRQANKMLGLFDASISDEWRMVGKILLATCSLPEYKTASDNTALHVVSAFSRDAKQFHAVLNISPNINLRNCNGQTPLDVAVAFNQRVWMNVLARHNGKQAAEL